MLKDCRLELLKRKPLSPWLLDGSDVCAIPTGHVDEAQAEIALHRHQNGVTGFNGVRQGCLHGRTPGSAHRQRETVFGLPGIAEKFLNFAHQLHIKRIEVPDGCSSQCLENCRVGIGRPRSKEKSVRGGDRVEAPAVTVVYGKE